MNAKKRAAKKVEEAPAAEAEATEAPAVEAEATDEAKA